MDWASLQDCQCSCFTLRTRRLLHVNPSRAFPSNPIYVPSLALQTFHSKHSEVDPSAMDSSKTSAILIAFLLSLYSTAPIVSGGYCAPPMHKPPRSKHQRPRFPGGPPTGKPPVTVPPVIGNPPITFPPIIGGPPVTGPPGVGVPPGTIPPGNTPTVPSPGAPGSTTTCPVDAIRIGACVDLLGGLVHVVIGDPAANQCCPLLQGLLELEAAVCLCTSIRLRLLSINIYLPLALQLLITCGITPPPGFTCTVN